MDFSKDLEKIKKEVRKVVVGQDKVVEGVLRAILADGHVLIEGVPGIAKTLLIRALSEASGCKFSRIQFTVDLLPADISGITTYTPGKGFETIKGPIFANFIIADEINRAPPKCVLGDTPIIIENGEVSDIKRIIKKYNGKKTYKNNDEYWIIPKKKLKLLAFDLTNYKIKPEEVKYLYKQKTSEPFYEVELKSGRKIKTSKIHPFFTLENGKVKTIQADELKDGMCVLIPKKLPVSGNNKLVYNKKYLGISNKIKKEIVRRKRLYKDVEKYKELNMSYKKIEKKLKINNKTDENLVRTFLKTKPQYLNYGDCFFSDSKQFGRIRGIKKPDFLTKEFAKFMAILIAEANVNKSYFYLTMKDKEIPELFIKLIKELFDVDVNLLYDNKRKMYRVAFRSDALVDLLKALEYSPHQKAGKKQIPNFILSSTEECIKEFLRLYYECNGSISRDCVKVTTKSKEVANSLSYLLLRMGFVSKINKELSRTKIGDYIYKRNFYNLRLYGPELPDFHQKIGFFAKEKNEKLKGLIKNINRKFTDLIPGMHGIIKDFRRKKSLTHKEFYNLTGMHAHNLENPKNSQTHSRYRLKKIIKQFNEDSDSFPITRLVNGDFNCDYVKKAKEIKPKKDYWLYDFSMKNNHSFVAGFGGIISHNTQSALLEAMQEKQVTIGRETFKLTPPFFVMANHNPIESSGTYKLPEAQIDRFLFKLNMGYPTNQQEEDIIDHNISIHKFEDFGIKPIISADKIIKMQKLTKKIHMSPQIKKYIVQIVETTRNPKEQGISLGKYIEWGGSPRASISLGIGAKADAVLKGEKAVTPQNIKNIAHDVLRHRIILNYSGQAENINPDKIINEILSKVRVP